MFTAVASAEFWEKHFRRKISPHAKGVTLIKDGKKTVYYDVSETETTARNPMDVRLWQYDDTAHKKFINAMVSDEVDTEKQIHVIAEELANRNSIDKKSKKLLALAGFLKLLIRTTRTGIARRGSCKVCSLIKSITSREALF
ncbi:MAG: hypothetical protein IJG33_03700 [Selenomonadaceae bacterium]|nr:hypothetical protein [Selenomonadaceae bacterium]